MRKYLRHNLVKKLFSEKEQGKNIYCTFRGEKGLLEISKVFFMPKKVESENVKNAEVSPFAKTIETLNDNERGAFWCNANFNASESEVKYTC